LDNSHGDSSVLHIGGSDMCSAAIKGPHCCVSMATLSLFFYAVARDRCTSTVQSDCIVAFSRQQCLRESATLLHYTYIAFLLAHSLRFLPYKATNQAKCFVCHNIFKLLKLIWINLVVKGINCYIHIQIRQWSSMAYSKVKGLLNFIVTFWIRYNILNHSN
jgi:hypothetical protein